MRNNNKQSTPRTLNLSGITHYASRITLLVFLFSMFIYSTFGGYAEAVCVRNYPSVHFTPTSKVIGLTDSKDYIVTIVNNDTAECDSFGSSTFNLSIFSDSGAGFSASVLNAPTSVILNAGRRGNTTLTVTSSGAAEGAKRTTIIQAAEGTNHSGKTGKGSVVTKASAVTGDARILGRAKEETCHACHKTDRNRTPSDPDWGEAIKTHSSRYLTPDSPKWGGWGVAGGKYGEFVCTTCHTAHDTRNIYLIEETINAPDVSSGNLPGAAGESTVDLRQKAAGPDPGTMGDDSSSHEKSQRACEYCHTYDNTGTSGTKVHAYNMTETKSHFGTTVCTDCHKHNVAFSTAGITCAACHGAPPTGAPLAAHAKHYGIADVPTAYGDVTFRSTATLYGFSCGKCHLSGPHIDETPANGSTDDVSFDDSTYPKNPDATYAFETKECSNLYCHGNFTGGKAATPTWTGSAGCGTCHGKDASDPPGTVASGSSSSHAAHITGSTVNLGCEKCHNEYTKKNIHVNGSTNWYLDSTDSRIGSGTYKGAASGTNPSPGGEAYGQCSNIYCHGSGTPTWGGALAADCTSCHGGNATSTSAMTLNNHPDHMNQAAVLGTNYVCAQCHSTTVSASSDRVITGAVHVNGTKDVSMLLGGTWAAGNCTSTYCHSSGKGTYVNPDAWGSATDLGCNGCHGTGNALGRPDYANDGAGTANANSHLKHAVAAGDCNTCHKDTTTTGLAIKAGSILHTDKSLDVAFDTTKAGASATWTVGEKKCSTTYCHGTGTPVWGGAMAADCTSCHGGNATSAAPIALVNHPDHMNQAAVLGTNYVCAQCHSTTVSASSDRVITGTVHINGTKDVSMLLGGTWAAGNCTSTYCHSSGKGTYVNPDAWGSATDLGCNGCHGTGNALGRPDYANQGEGLPNANSHLKHAVAAADCNTCHTDTTTTGTNIKASSILHTNQSLNVTFDTTKAGASATWTAGTKTCTTTYCHSSGQAADGGEGAPTYQTVAWGGTVVCGNCHKTKTGDPLGAIDTGSHTKHLAGASTCGDCHTGATDSAYNSTAHVDRSIDVAAGVSYTKGGTPGNGYGTCTTVCHSPTTTPVATPTWGTAAACNSCHPIVPATGSHTKHLTTTNFEQAVCADCHDGTIQGTTGPVSHGNQKIDVYDLTPGDLGYPQKDKGTPYTNCTTAYCHSNGAGTYVSVTWGSTVACGSCHGAPPNTGAHVQHFGGTTAEAAYTSDGNISTTTTYKFNCANCHPLNVSSHANGTVDIELYNASATGQKKLNTTASKIGAGGTTVCLNIYCHSNGKVAYANTPQWSSAFAGDKCAGCHGNSPSSNAHLAHAVAIHYDNIYNGTLGKVSATDTTGTGAGHGDPNVSSTISCNVCHNDTVTASYNRRNPVCSACHLADGSPAKGDESLVIADKSKHINESIDIKFALTGFKSRAQIRDSITTVTELNNSWTRTNGYKGAASYDAAKSTPSYAGGTCSSVACHNGNTVAWTAGAISCNACHTALPQAQ